MNLYLIEQNENEDCEAWSRAVVVAENEDDACSIHPRLGVNWDGVSNKWGEWTHKKNVRAMLIGKSNTSTPKVILAE